MKNMAAPQTSTATDCDLGLVMRGTLVASAMVQKLRIPSTKTRLDHELHTMNNTAVGTYRLRQQSGLQAQVGSGIHQ